MFRKYTIDICKRLYHDSSFKQQKDPIAKIANSRVRGAIKRRLDHEAQPRVRQYDPSKKFEPFPFAVTEENKLEILNRLVTPLHDISYEEQLASKESYCRNSLRHFAQQLYKLNTPVRLDVKRLPCHVDSIVRVPQIYNYRNKDEFSIWRGIDGKTNTIGFMAFPIGKHGDTVCIEPNGCVVVKEPVIKMTDILQEFIRHQAKLSVSYSLGQDGGWRRFMIKNNTLDELMLTGVLNPRTLKVKDVIDERENFKEFVVKRATDAGLKLKSLYFQPCPHNRCPHHHVPFELLYGDKTLEENINQFKFQISPESYIPQNTIGAEILYKTVRSIVENSFEFRANKKPLILDIGCGAGLLSVHLADIGSKVIGIDKSAQSIEDARSNAELNNLKNLEFINSEVEIVLERVLEKFSKFKENETLVVCHPTKVGLHSNVVQALRNCLDVKKIIYITSKVDGTWIMDNLVTLCKKESGGSAPAFVPISATPVDISPHIESCELIIVLERLTE